MLLFGMVAIGVANILLYVVYSGLIHSHFNDKLPEYRQYAGIISATLSLITMTVFSSSGRSLSLFLTKIENHRTHTGYTSNSIFENLEL
jgi:hypothetical protein